MKWMGTSTSFTMMPDTNYCDIIVPTMDTIRMSYVLEMLLTNRKPVSAPPHLQHPTSEAQLLAACRA